MTEQEERQEYLTEQARIFNEKRAKESLLIEQAKLKKILNITQLELFSEIDDRATFLCFPSHKIAILKNDYWQQEVSLQLVKMKDWLTDESSIPCVFDSPSNLKALGYTLVYPQNNIKFQCKPSANWQRTYSGSQIQVIRIVDI